MGTVIELRPQVQTTPRIRELREERDWTLGQLAQRARVKADLIERYEDGETRIPDGHVSNLCMALDVSREYLTGQDVECDLTPEASAVLVEATLVMRGWAERLHGVDTGWSGAFTICVSELNRALGRRRPFPSGTAPEWSAGDAS